MLRSISLKVEILLSHQLKTRINKDSNLRPQVVQASAAKLRQQALDTSQQVLRERLLEEHWVIWRMRTMG